MGLLVAKELLGFEERKVGELYYLIFTWDCTCMYHCGDLEGSTADGVLACMHGWCCFVDDRLRCK
jgi:hypothetical protein